MYDVAQSFSAMHGLCIMKYRNGIVPPDNAYFRCLKSYII